MRGRRGWHAKVEELTMAGRVTRFEYDAWGRMISMTAPDGGRTSFVYDLRGQLVAKRDPAGREARYEYDGEGNLLTVQAPDGTARRASYNALGWILSATFADGLTTELRYDHEGEIVEAIDPRGEVHRFRYDRDGWLIEASFPDGRIESYRYDKAGRCIQTRAQGRLVSQCSYDLAGNLVREEHEDGTVVTFTYDALDFMLTAEAPSAKVRFTRDLCGNVVEETQEIGARRFVVRSKYAATGRRVEREVGGHTTGLAFSGDGEVTGRWLDGELESLEFDGVGRLRRATRTRGLSIARDYDALGFLQHERVSRPTAARFVDEGLTEAAADRAVIDRTYEYTDHLELARMREHVGGQSEDYTYDPFGRLVSASDGRSPPVDFAHDASSNLVGMGRRQQFFGKGGRLERTDAHELRFDAAGRMIEKRTPGAGARPTAEWWTYTWCAYGLKEARHSSGKVVTFDYDALGRRVKKSVAGGSSVVFVWDANSLAQEVVSRKGAAERCVTYAFEEGDPFTPVAVKPDGEWLTVVSTPAGLPTELVDAAGDVVWSLRTDPYGGTSREVDPGNLGFQLRFQGQYLDEETGLHHNRFRTYDPELGVYLEPDPIGPEGGLNAYAYARNPIGWVDPLGLENGAALRAGMGTPCPPGFQAHHLIPEELYDTPGYKQLLGKDPHTADNGIYLPDSQGSYDAHKSSGKPPQPPGQTIHSGRHSSAYKNYVKSELDRIKGLPPCQRKPALAKLKADLHDKMQNGTFTGTSTSGKTVSGLNKNGNVTP